MLPTNPRIQPVKGGSLRDRVSAGWGNGLISELHLPQENGHFAHQVVGPISFGGSNSTFFDVYGRCESTFGPHEWFATGHVFDVSNAVPNINRIICDQMFSYLVTDELLSTEDYTTFQSVHGTFGTSNGDWLREPAPVVTVNGSVKDEGSDYTVDYTNGRVVFHVCIKGDTLLTTQANSNSSTLQVVSTVGFEAGDCITVKGLSSMQDEVVSVAEVTDSTTLTLNELLAYNHSSGSQIIENNPVVAATYRYLEQHYCRQELNPITPGNPNSGLVLGFTEIPEKSDGVSGILRVKNPAFLNWTSASALNAWTLEGAGTATISKTSSSLFGSQTVKLDNVASTGFRYLRQDVNCQTTSDVVLSCWVNTSNRAKVEIIPSDGPGSYTILDVNASQPMAKFANKWVRVTVLTNGAPPYQIRLYGQSVADDGGSTKFDGVMLTEI